MWSGHTLRIGHDDFTNEAKERKKPGGPKKPGGGDSYMNYKMKKSHLSAMAQFVSNSKKIENLQRGDNWER